MKQGLGQGLGRQPGHQVLAPVAALSGAPQSPERTKKDHTQPEVSTERFCSCQEGRGGKQNVSGTHSAWHYAGLYSLTFSSQRKNLAHKLTDDFKIYLNKWGGQQRLLANCIIGLRPRCFGDFPLILNPAVKIQAVQPRHGAGVCLCG